MAKKENKFKGYDISTQAVHTGVGYDAETGAVRRPLHMANSYKLPDDLSKVNYSSTDLLMYARNGNPNQHWLEEKVVALHNADDAIVLASGVAALHALLKPEGQDIVRRQRVGIARRQRQASPRGQRAAGG